MEHPAKAESKEGACTRTTSQAESLLAAEKRTLEMIADGASLKEILDDLCHSIDVVVSPVISTVLLMDADGERLWHTAGTLVSREWLPVVSPLRIFPHAGCCGAAAFMKERVIVADIATDINWLDEYRDLAIKNRDPRGVVRARDFDEGWRSAWHSFALYSSESRISTDAEIEFIEGAGQIALIAIERQRSQAALALALEKIKRNEESLRLIVDSIPGQIAVMSAGGEVELVNRQILEYFGKTTEELQNWATSNSFHPDDILRTIDAWKRAL